MLTSVLALALGVALVYFGAEWLVTGAVGVARRLGISALICGLTVVAYGTSAPELVVSLVAAAGGQSDMALGNVVGSSIANIGLILGVTALAAPLRVEDGLMKWELPVLVAATAAVPVLLGDGAVSRLDGFLLLLGAALFTVITVRRGHAPVALKAAAVVERDAETTGAPGWRRTAWLVGLTVAGLTLLVGGGKVFITGATKLALLLGLSEQVVGLTVVAVGTSLPELAASVVAAVRGHSSLAVGNVLGSNIFNSLFALGGAAAVHPLATSFDDLRVDLLLLLAFTVAAVYLTHRERRIRRWEGLLLVLLYAGFVTRSLIAL